MRGCNSCPLQDVFLCCASPLEMISDFSGSEAIPCHNEIDIYLWVRLVWTKVITLMAPNKGDLQLGTTMSRT